MFIHNYGIRVSCWGDLLNLGTVCTFIVGRVGPSRGLLGAILASWAIVISRCLFASLSLSLSVSLSLSLCLSVIHTHVCVWLCAIIDQALERADPLYLEMMECTILLPVFTNGNIENT